MHAQVHVQARRDGRNLLNALGNGARAKATAFCDVDPKKIGTTYHNAGTGTRVPVVHFTQAEPPFVCCVALGRTEGAFERNLASLNLVEGRDYYHFN